MKNLQIFHTVTFQVPW